jgi:hypothetical protein
VFPWQRDIRVPTVRTLAAAMTAGTFVGPCALVVVIEETDVNAV